VKHIINYSGGICSFWAAKRVVAKYGAADVVLLFADTLIEDPDLYRFNQETSAHLGIPITRVCVGLTPWQLFRRQGMIANNKFPLCSIYLKREPLDEWHAQNCWEMDTTIYIGMDWTEGHRLENMRRDKPHWRIEAPMTEEPIWDKCRMIAETEKLGIEIPRLYKLGFPHNNCGGRCVRAGQSHFVHLLRVLPEQYREWEEEELATQADLDSRGISSAWYSILRDRRGGTTKTMTLRQLRERVEAGEDFPRDDWGGCGCGVQYAEPVLANKADSTTCST